MKKRRFIFFNSSNHLLLLIVLGVSVSLNAQIYPGGVSTGLETWLRADSNVVGTAPVSAWNNMNATGTPTVLHGSPNLDNTTTSFNYNQVIRFAAPVNTTTVNWAWDPIRQFVSLSGYSFISGIDYGSLFFCLSLDQLNRPATHLATACGITYSGVPNGTLHGGWIPPNTTYDSGEPDFIGASCWQKNGATVNYSNPHSTVKSIVSAVATANSTTLNCFLGGQWDGGSTFFGGERDWKGPVGEVIGYTSRLSNTERNKITTYLAVKYGLTIVGNDYFATNGSTIYNNISPYTNNIIGIGKDNIEGLRQKQSHTNDDAVRVYLGTLAPMNKQNTSSIVNDISYVMMGDNNDVICATTAANAEIPTSLPCIITSRIAREWKVQKTNFNSSFNMDIKLPACASPGTVSALALTMLVDDDGNFSNGGTQCYYNGDGSGIVISYLNPVVSISGISNLHLPSTKYITLASTSPIIPLPIGLIQFDGACNDGRVQLKWSTASELNMNKFELEFSENGTDWQVINTQPGQGGDALTNYTYTHVITTNGIVYYRLKQIDVDGAFTFSDIISVHCLNPDEQDFQVIMNAANNPCVIKVTDTNFFGSCTISFVNMFGQVVLNQSVQIDKNGKGELNETNNALAAGCYFVQLINQFGERKQVKQIVY